jgi:hypothetical protein
MNKRQRTRFRVLYQEDEKRQRAEQPKSTKPEKQNTWSKPPGNDQQSSFKGGGKGGHAPWNTKGGGGKGSQHWRSGGKGSSNITEGSKSWSDAQEYF